MVILLLLLLMMKKIVPFFVGFARANCGEGGDPANYGSTRRRSWGGLYSSMISRILINTLLIILRACHEYDDTLPMIDQDCCWWKRPAGDEQVQHPEHSLPEDNNLQHVSINPKIIMTIHMMIMMIPMMIMMNPMMIMTIPMMIMTIRMTTVRIRPTPPSSGIGSSGEERSSEEERRFPRFASL